MKDNPLVPFAFDPGELVRETQSRFGWSEEDLGTAMSALIGAAASGMRVLSQGGTFDVNGFRPAASGNPFQMFGTAFSAQDDSPYLAMAYGPRPVREVVAAQIATMTGLQREAIMDMMPVAATLAVGQMARPYVPEEARELLDAFMRGYARGRPKPPPSPTDYMQGYAEAVQSFWAGFLKPFSGSMDPKDVEDAPEGDPDANLANAPEDDFPADDADPDDLEAATDETEDTPLEKTSFDGMVTDWMTRSRDFQVSQFRAFDSLFERAVKDMESGAKSD